jgi:hypothetical protein
MPEFLKRSIIDFLVFISILVLPWYISIIIVLGLIIYFNFYLESLFFAFMFDSIYLGHFDFPYTFVSICSIVLLVSVFIKTRIRR